MAKCVEFHWVDEQRHSRRKQAAKEGKLRLGPHVVIRSSNGEEDATIILEMKMTALSLTKLQRGPGPPGHQTCMPSREPDTLQESNKEAAIHHLGLYSMASGCHRFLIHDSCLSPPSPDE